MATAARGCVALTPRRRYTARMNERFDVIVVGAGHAGCEAAAAAARIGARTLVLTAPARHDRRRCRATRRSAASPRATSSTRSTRSAARWAASPTRPASSSAAQPQQGPGGARPRAQADQRRYRDAMRRRCWRPAQPDLRRRRRSPSCSADGRPPSRDRHCADGRRIGCARRHPHDRHVPARQIHVGERATPAGASGEAPRSGLSARWRGRLSAGPAQDRHAAAPRRPHASTGPRSSASRATIRRRRSQPLTRRSRRCRSVPAGSRTTNARDPRHHPRQPRTARRSTAARSPAPGRATARGSRTRWCASPTSERPPDLPRARGPRRRRGLPERHLAPAAGRRPAARSSARSPGWSARDDPAARLRGRYDFVDPRELQPTLETTRVRGPLSSPARSTAPPATRRRRRRACSPASTPRAACRRRGAASSSAAIEAYVGVLVDDLVTQGRASRTACSPRAPSTG